MVNHNMIKLSDLHKLWVSQLKKTPEDDEGCFIIGEIDIDLYDKNNQNILLLKNTLNNKDKRSIFHFYLDGDIRL
ncbi:MAG: hypothetical protein WBA13_01120 [Microcoleaceae cyanobacterium]